VARRCHAQGEVGLAAPKPQRQSRSAETGRAFSGGRRRLVRRAAREIGQTPVVSGAAAAKKACGRPSACGVRAGRAALRAARAARGTRCARSACGRRAG